MTVMGNSPEWVQTLLAAFRLGAVALPCVTQSRPGDLALRARHTAPAVVVTTEAYAELVRAAALDCPVARRCRTPRSPPRSRRGTPTSPRTTRPC